MEKITKLATIVAKAARMEKKAEYYDAIATFINPDGNYFEKRKFMGEYTEDEIIKEVIREFPKVKKEDIDIEFGVQSSKKVKLNKKAEKEKYEVPVRLVFRGMVTCEADSSDEADNIVLQNFSGILDHCENNLEESIVDWDIETHSDIEFDEEQVVATKQSNLNKKASMADIEIKIKQEKDYFMVYMGTVDSSGIKKKCKNTFEIVETLRNYVENRIMESK